MPEEARLLTREDYDGASARLVRYLAALLILVYGFAKVNGSQFTILDSEVDKPLGQVGGFWLTRYYFGFSKIYSSFIAAAEIGGAIMLTIRRTTLLGACLLALVLTNIILIGISYGIDPGATSVAFLLMLAMVWLISMKWNDLLAVFWRPAQSLSSRGSPLWSSWAVRLAMLLFAFAFTYWVANYNNRVPTPLDGVWDVVQVAPKSIEKQVPKTIFFERNRAYMSVFKFYGGVYESHHFEVDRKKTQIRLWERWLTKGDLIFEGTYKLSGSELELQGTFSNVGDTRIRLQQR